MKNFCGSLREHAMKIVNFKKKNMKLLTKEQQEYINMQKSVIFAQKIENKYLKDKKYRKVRYHRYYTEDCRGAAYSICNLKYGVRKKIPIAFHNGFKACLCYFLSNYYFSPNGSPS